MYQLTLIVLGREGGSGNGNGKSARTYQDLSNWPYDACLHKNNTALTKKLPNKEVKQRQYYKVKEHFTPILLGLSLI